MSGLELDRTFLTFHELVMRWNGDVNLVRYELAKGGLVPTCFVDQPAVLDGSEDGEPVQLRGPYYMHSPQMTAVLDCTFQRASTDPKASKGAQCWSLGEAVSLDAVLSVGVLDVEQVEKYEHANPRKVSLGQVRMELRTLERASLLKLVIGMAISAYRYEPRDRRSAVIPEIANDVRALGMSMDDDTVRKYVYEAAESHLPAHWRQLLKAA